MQHSLNSMVKHTTEAESEVEISCRRLEEALLDATLAPSANATTPTLRGNSKLPGNLSSTLKLQQGKLGDLFSHLKENIANFNKRESEQKKDAAVYAERLKKRLEQDKKRLEDPKLSDFDREMLVNRTRTEEHEMKFWTRGRELQHDMFHSNLKLTHGLMSRVKTVMDAYKQVMATGKLDAGLTKVLHDTAASMPKALIQKEKSHPEYALILAFDVPVNREAQAQADKDGVQIFTADIIYHLQEKFKTHMEKIQESKKQHDSVQRRYHCYPTC